MRTRTGPSRSAYPRWMNLHEVERALERWQEHGLLSGDQAQAIVAFEAADQGLDPAELDALEGGGFDVGSLLAYGGVLVALVAMVGIHFALMDDFAPAARFGIASAAAAGAVVLAFGLGKVRGAAAADALGFAATILIAAAVLQGCEAAGWLESDANGDADLSVRFSFLVTAIVAGAAGWALALKIPAPLAAMSASAFLAGAAAVLGWFVADNDEGPGAIGGQMAVVAGFALATLALVPNALRMDRPALRFWAIGALIAANVAAFLLAAVEGGVYEGLLLPYAFGTGVAAVLSKQRALLVFAALFLYEYVGFVVFRTFGGAVAAIIVLALIGLGTAIGGTMAQRGLGRSLFQRR